MAIKIAMFLTALLISASSAFASNVGVDLNVNIGAPPPPPPVIIRETEAPPEESIIIEDDVEFIYPSSLGFYVGVGVPFDLFFINNLYFTFRNGHWYKSRHHRGPWVVTNHRHLPPGLRKHKIERLRHFRDREYVIYQRERDHYRGRHFRTGRDERKEHRRDLRDERKMEKRHEKHERREHRERRGDD